MTRKHFQMIADTIKAQMSNPKTAPGAEAIARAMVPELKYQNRNFRADLFLKACGL